MQPPRKPPAGRQGPEREPVYRKPDERWTGAERRQPGGRGGAPSGSGGGAPPEREPFWLRYTYLHKWHFLIAIALVCAFGLIMVTNSMRLRALDDELIEAKQALFEVNEELAHKAQELSFAQTDAYIEQEARRRFGFIRPDETRFLADNYAQTEPANTAPPETDDAQADADPPWLPVTEAGGAGAAP